MTQRFKVQDGQVIFESSDPSYDLNMDINGRVNVLRELNVGNDSYINGNITSTFNIIKSVDTLAAAGIDYATATPLTKDINIISSVSAGQGVVLPVEQAGLTIIIINQGLNALNVYPNSLSADIDGLGIGIPFSLTVNKRIMFICSSLSQWYTLNAT